MAISFVNGARTNTGTNFTAGAGTDRCVIVLWESTTGTAYPTAPTYGTQSLVAVGGNEAAGTGSGTRRLQCWYILEAGIAARSTDAWGGFAGGSIFVCCWSGVDQATPIRGFFIDEQTIGTGPIPVSGTQDMEVSSASQTVTGTASSEDAGQIYMIVPAGSGAANHTLSGTIQVANNGSELSAWYDETLVPAGYTFGWNDAFQALDQYHFMTVSIKASNDLVGSFETKTTRRKHRRLFPDYAA